MPEPHSNEYLRIARKRVCAADGIVTGAYMERLPRGITAGDNLMATLLYRSAEMNLKLYDIAKGSESE